ncbi:MAG: 3-keto-disaccharide hydrolase [Bryobacteraceae bacterium]
MIGARLFLIATAVSATAGAVEPGFVSLFDGKSLAGWQFVAKHGSGYLPQNGLLVCPADGGGNLFTEKEFADFVFRFEFRLSPGGNNGVGIRAPLTGDVAYTGMEIQILDDGHERYQGRLKPTQYHGSIYDVIPAKQGFKKPAGEWNEEEITAKGRRITIKLNGATIVDADLDSVTDPVVLKKHPGLARTKGHIGFLGHGTLVEFRNIRIKELP